MKNIKIILILFFIIFLYIYVVKGKNVMKIYIDPGHGGIDVGATYKDIYEKDLNLEYSYILKEKLEKEGYIVYLTRYSDYDLSIKSQKRKQSDLNNRIKLINDSNADLLISIHMNSDDTGLWNGPQVFYNLEESKNIALSVQNGLNKVSKNKRKIVKTNDIKILKEVKKESILIEIGFLSNTYERNKIIDKKYMEEICNSIVYSLKGV